MIGPAVQGVLLVSVIYWYSKGMLSLINDYYRDEFKTYIGKDAKTPKTAPKKVQLSFDQIESCPAQHVEGLPDLLKSTNQHSRADGIVIRDIEKTSPDKYKHCNSQPASTDKARQYVAEEMSNYATGHGRQEANINREKIRQHSKPIVNPSEIGQSNYKQMTNQQVSSTDDDEDDSKCSTRTSSNPNSGNCLESVGRVADVPGRKAEMYGRDEDDPSPSMRPELPKIAVNGVLMPTDELRKRIDEKLRKDTCERKTVNEMVKYWTHFLEAMDAKEQTSHVLRQPSPTGKPGQLSSSLMARSKSSGNIIGPSRATTSSQDNS